LPDPGCGAGPIDHHQSLLVEREHAEWLLAERVVPGTEVHQDRDVTWVVHTGDAWRNSGIMVRLSPSSAARRLDALVARYRRHRRGMVLWISPLATPSHITDLLIARRLRCRKYFPAMIRHLGDRVSPCRRPNGVVIRQVHDVAEFRSTPHPAIGPLTTTLRRSAFERLGALVSAPSARTRNYVAWLDDKPAGAIEVFLGSECAGIHGLSVLDRHQDRGIASALIEHACDDARTLGAQTIGLLASSEGQRLYMQRGFREVARFGCWYRSFQRHR
jgi:ribosomal protein S18 acetylase RimI-like enzyme